MKSSSPSVFLGAIHTVSAWSKVDTFKKTRAKVVCNARMQRTLNGQPAPSKGTQCRKRTLGLNHGERRRPRHRRSIVGR